METTLVPTAELNGHGVPAHDAYLLERYRWGSPRLVLEELSSPLARELAEAMLATGGGDRDMALEEKLALLPDQVADGVRCALVAVNIDQPPVSGPSQRPASARSEESGPLAPALPGCVLDGASPDAWLVGRESEACALAAPWVDLYLDYALSVVPMTMESFHVSAALWLGAVAIARRLMVPMPHGDIFPNLFIVWIAESSVWHKSTSLKLARNLAASVLPHLLAAHDTTYEALLCDLAGREPVGLAEMSDGERSAWLRERDFSAQRGLLLDELSGLLASAGRDYNSGLMTAFLRFYDCEASYSRSTRSGGRVTVRNSYLSVLGASTPAALAPFLSGLTAWNNGWWPRFALLTPDRDAPEWESSSERREIPAELPVALRRLNDRLPLTTWPNPPEARAVTFGDGAYADLERYTKAVTYELRGPALTEQLKYVYSRLADQVIKVSTILAALDWPEELRSPRIERHHLARALVIVEEWRESAHRLVTTMSKPASERLADRIVALLPQFLPDGATPRDLARRIPGVAPRSARAVLEELESEGTVSRRQVRTAGRPCERFLLVV